MIINEEKMNEIVKVELTRREIDLLIDELERAPYNVFVFLSYKDIIKKLKNLEKK